VMTENPYTRCAAKVFKSACKPAPPPGSLPAIVIATGLFVAFVIGNQTQRQIMRGPKFSTRRALLRFDA
jgi:Na+/H+ antiporter NhaC